MPRRRSTSRVSDARRRCRRSRSSSGQFGVADRFVEQLTVEQNRRERVLDLVRETTRHRAEFGETFRLSRTPLRLPRAEFTAAQQDTPDPEHDRRSDRDAEAARPKQFPCRHARVTRRR